MAKAIKPNSLFVGIHGGKQFIEICCPSSFNKTDRDQVKRMVKESRSAVTVEDDFRTDKTIYYKVSIQKVQQKPLVFRLERSERSAYIGRPARRTKDFLDMAHILKQLCL